MELGNVLRGRGRRIGLGWVQVSPLLLLVIFFVPEASQFHLRQPKANSNNSRIELVSSDSLSIVAYNVCGLNNKLFNVDFISFICKFDGFFFLKRFWKEGLMSKEFREYFPVNTFCSSRPLNSIIAGEPVGDVFMVGSDEGRI